MPLASFRSQKPSNTSVDFFILALGARSVDYIVWVQEFCFRAPFWGVTMACVISLPAKTAVAAVSAKRWMGVDSERRC